MSVEYDFLLFQKCSQQISLVGYFRSLLDAFKTRYLTQCVIGNSLESADEIKEAYLTFFHNPPATLRDLSNDLKSRLEILEITIEDAISRIMRIYKNYSILLHCYDLLGASVNNATALMLAQNMPDVDKKDKEVVLLLKSVTPSLGLLGVPLSIYQ